MAQSFGPSTCAGYGGSMAEHEAPIRWRDGMAAPAGRTLADEVPVAIVVNGTTVAVLLATPADLADFATGFVLTEGLVRDRRRGRRGRGRHPRRRHRGAAGDRRLRRAALPPPDDHRPERLRPVRGREPRRRGCRAAGGDCTGTAPDAGRDRRRGRRPRRRAAARPRRRAPSMVRRCGGGGSRSSSARTSAATTRSTS